MESVAAEVLLLWSLEPFEFVLGAARGGVIGIAVRVSGVRGEVGVGGALPTVFVVVGKVRMGLWMAVMFRMEGEVVCGGIIRGRRMGRWGLGDGICVRCGDGGMWLGWVFVVLVSLVAIEG